MANYCPECNTITRELGPDVNEGALLTEIRDILLRIEKNIGEYDAERFANWLWNSPLPEEDRAFGESPDAKSKTE